MRPPPSTGMVRLPMLLTRFLAILLFVSSVPLNVLAQTPAPATRAEALRQEREKKQQQLRPNRPDKLQRAMDYAEDRALFLIARDGFHPKLGSLTTGSGFAFGVGFRDRDLFRKRARLELWTAASLKKYWAMEVRLAAPDLPGGRLVGEVVASLREYPQEDFFGLGPASLRENRSSFSLRTAQVSGMAGVR